RTSGAPRPRQRRRSVPVQILLAGKHQVHGVQQGGFAGLIRADHEQVTANANQHVFVVVETDQADGAEPQRLHDSTSSISTDSTLFGSDSGSFSTGLLLSI